MLAVFLNGCVFFVCVFKGAHFCGGFRHSIQGSIDPVEKPSKLIYILFDNCLQLFSGAIVLFHMQNLAISRFYCVEDGN